MSKNIVLVGLMGAGKSSVGKKVADKLDFTFVDSDMLIEQAEKCSITKIFEQKGEKYFRQLEASIIEGLKKKTDMVISTGGGCLQNNNNLCCLKQNGFLIYLEASAEVLYSRIKNDSTRPLLANENPLGVLKDLLGIREKNYKKANHIINTDFKTIEDITNEIVKVYNANC